MQDIRYIATAAFGLEAIVAYELKQLGYTEVKVENGRVAFLAGADAAARCNLWLRSADRLLIEVGRFSARSFDELFEGTRALPWQDWLPKNARFPVNGKTIKSQLYSVSDCQAIVKKATVEKLKQSYPQKWFAEDGPLYQLEVSILEDNVSITMDCSGAGLHKRGYRKEQGEAPLKETLAAAMVSLSRWKKDRPLIDPFCGSGTIAIEAAMIACNIAPGLRRSFDAEHWPQFSPRIWSQARQEALDSVKIYNDLGIEGFDIDRSCIKLARSNALRAGIAKQISFRTGAVRELKSPFHYGYLICNPPYGERLLDDKQIKSVYQDLAKSWAHLNTWSAYILTPYQGLEKVMGRKADKRRKLFNGRIPCTFYQFYGPRPEQIKGPFAMQMDQSQKVFTPR
jgi:putative N6-adenine-specific DNA methylase